MKKYKPYLINQSLKQVGFTITEMMVAMSLGIILMSGIGQIYLSSKQTYAMNDELISFQENGRYITSRIAEEIRMAGHAGCVDTYERGMQFTADFAATASSFYVTPLQGFEFSTTASPNPSLPTGLNGPAINALNPAAVANSDILSIQYGSYIVNEMTANMTSLTFNIAISNSNPLMQSINPNDVLLISDCQMANVFVAGTGSNSSLVSHSALNKIFAQDTDSGLWPTIMHFVSNTYYVGVDSGVNALYVRDNFTGNSAKIFEGIDSLNIVYGVADASGTRYLAADAITASNLMDDIFSVRISFNLRSVNTVDTATVSGSTKDYITKQFTSTVILRNQGDW